ncbi:hypothetical protein QT711_00230 [Sporosarcina saromensis]|uniref:Uncharacterized protein n=1 Tax=Sporosarcina saromensis TaxID=359365 RepID=A0ABU4G3N9_9BACL|nr:ABC-three component system middle component 6 [Sporosarcina saromensis]MDW0111588.1 hypothetical protein [Sporosarcina saromensis]
MPNNNIWNAGIVHTHNIELIIEIKLKEVVRVLLPNKYIHEERTIVMVGGKLIHLLRNPVTVTQLWDSYRKQQEIQNLPQVPFDLFILTLDFLYIIGVIDFRKGKLRRLTHDQQNI